MERTASRIARHLRDGTLLPVAAHKTGLSCTPHSRDLVNLLCDGPRAPRFFPAQIGLVHHTAIPRPLLARSLPCAQSIAGRCHLRMASQ